MVKRIIKTYSTNSAGDFLIDQNDYNGSMLINVVGIDMSDNQLSILRINTNGKSAYVRSGIKSGATQVHLYYV